MTKNLLNHDSVSLADLIDFLQDLDQQFKDNGHHTTVPHIKFMGRGLEGTVSLEIADIDLYVGQVGVFDQVIITFRRS